MVQRIGFNKCSTVCFAIPVGFDGKDNGGIDQTEVFSRHYRHLCSRKPLSDILTT